MNMEFLAWVKSWRRKRLSGVGGHGGVVKMRRNRGLMWWGEGSRIVCGGGDSREKFVCLISDVVNGNFADSRAPFDSSSAGRNAGNEVLPRDQKATQKSNSFSVIPPLISIQPSNQFSQLTLQDGINASFRSTSINFGCMTLNGRTKTLLISSSKPSSFSGGGNPRPIHVVRGYILPSSDDVWNSFWNMEREEKHIRTWILRFWAKALVDSFRSNEAIAS